MTGWEAAFIDRIEGKKIVLAKRKLGFMYSRMSMGRSKRLYPGDTYFLDQYQGLYKMI